MKCEQIIDTYFICFAASGVEDFGRQVAVVEKRGKLYSFWKRSKACPRTAKNWRGREISTSDSRPARTVPRAMEPVLPCLLAAGVLRNFVRTSEVRNFTGKFYDHLVTQVVSFLMSLAKSVPSVSDTRAIPLI